MFLSAVLIIYFTTKLDIIPPDIIWIILIIYPSFAWSYSIYIEQMFTAELYLWNMKWEREVEKAKNQGKPLPELREVKRPSILDEIPDLLER